MNEKIFTKPFFLTFGALFCTAMVMYTLMSTVTEYAAEMGSGAAVAGLVSGIYIFGGLCSRLYSGPAMERMGWKKIALIFVGIHSVSCLFYFLVDNIALLLLVRFVHGIGFGASANAIVTIGMSFLPQSRFSEACGYLMLATTLAVGFGPYFGGIIYDTFGSDGCFLMAAVLCVLSFLFLLPVKVSAKGTRNSSESADSRSSGSLIDKFIEVKALPASIVTALSALGYASIMSFYRLYAAETGLENAFSKFFLLYSFILIFSRPLAGKIQDRRGDKIICIPGITAQVAGLLLLSLYPCTLTVILCAVCCAAGYGTLNSACNAMACRGVSPQRRSYAVSTFYICCDAAMGIGPALLGAVASSTGSYSFMYGFAAAATLLALPICIKSFKR